MTHLPPRFTRTRRRGGYVLVVTLGLLVTSATLLVAVGREAVRHALQARLEVDDLQRTWAVRSCRATLLSRCETVLKTHEGVTQQPTPAFRADVVLAGSRYELLISDEQAKANVNALIDLSGAASTESLLRRQLSGTGLANRVHLRPALVDMLPATTQGSARTMPRPVTSFGQVLDALAPETLFATPRGPFDRMTCFGDGSLNVVRATDPALRLALAPVLSTIEIDRLRDAQAALWKPRRRDASAAETSNLPTVDRLLRDARVTTPMRAKLGLSDSSTCHSLSIVARDGRRAWFYLFVRDDSNAKRPRVQTFVW